MTTDPFADADAAYVLGALDGAERRAFEEHLADCPHCQARVAEARDTAALLAGLPASAFADPEPAPDTLLPGLLRRASRERSRRRWLGGAVAGLAAAGVAALVIVALPGGGSSAPQALAFHAVRSSPVTATAQLVSHRWGTEIRLHCRYANEVPHYLPYDLTVVGKNGRPEQAGSWTLAEGGSTDFTTGTSLSRDQIDHLDITLPDGTPILQLTP